MSDSGIAGKSAWVSASSSGLGLACATALAREGAVVYINGRNQDRLQGALELIREKVPGAQVTAVAADLTSPEDRERIKAMDLAIDILVNNNRGPRPAKFPDATDADIDEAFQLHMWAPLAMVRAFLPGMRTRRFGRIVTITSAMVATPRNGQFASAGARTAFTAMMKALQSEVVAENITINQLLPERIDTPRQVQMAHVEMERSGVDFAEARRRQVASIAAGRLGQPEEFAQACVYLCREDSGFVSGMNFRLDGGSYPGLL